MKEAAVIVYCDGNVQRNVRNPTYLALHEANFVAIRDADGTFTIWKDREGKHASGLTAEAIEARVEYFVRWAQLYNMMPRV